jgi:aminoglycoside/choline kinase family phosphotransferase
MIAAASNRASERAAFLKEAGWLGARVESLAGDASTRSYQRLFLHGRSAILMNAPTAKESAACPPAATESERIGLGYNAMARLAGPNLHAFLAVASALRAAGLSAPQIYAADPTRGFALLEDLGDDLFARAIPLGANEQELYETAVDALLLLRRSRIFPENSAAYTMLAYDRVALVAEAALLVEWYWPFRTGSPPGAALDEHADLWAEALQAVSAPETMVLRDYHAENLLWLPERIGPQRVGVIDFQDALIGSAAYDLVSLLEDARRDVPPDLAQTMIARYCANAAGEDFSEDDFRRDYALLAAQRNAKILGIFARLVRRDGKPRYAELLPRVENHFRRDLLRPELARLRKFYGARLPELAP